MSIHGEAKSVFDPDNDSKSKAYASMVKTVCCLLQYLLHSFPLVLASQLLAGSLPPRIKDYISQLSLK